VGGLGAKPSSEPKAWLFSGRSRRCVAGAGTAVPGAARLRQGLTCPRPAAGHVLRIGETLAEGITKEFRYA